MSEDLLPICRYAPSEGVYFAIVGKFLKVGRSNNILRRFYGLYFEMNVDPEFLGFIHSSEPQERDAIERDCLKRLARFKARGREWHELSESSLHAAGEILGSHPCAVFQMRRNIYSDDRVWVTGEVL